jgi:hypothetical protein
MSELSREIERHVLAEVWTSNEVHRNLLHLCDDIGHRFAGSASEHAAAEFLRQKMAEYGLRDVHLEQFPMYSWERGESDVKVLSPVERPIAAVVMPYSPSSDVEGELIDLGEGRERGLALPSTATLSSPTRTRARAQVSAAATVPTSTDAPSKAVPSPACS